MTPIGDESGQATSRWELKQKSSLFQNIVYWTWFSNENSISWMALFIRMAVVRAANEIGPAADARKAFCKQNAIQWNGHHSLELLLIAN